MSTALSYTKAAFQAFTKIISADMNQYFTDIKSRLNWSGGTDATTGLGDDNVQSNAAAGGGLTRSTKLKAGTANYVLINDSTGKMSEEVTLATSRGGTNLNIDPTAQQAGDVIQVNATATALSIGAPTAVPASLRVFQFLNFS